MPVIPAIGIALGASAASAAAVGTIALGTVALGTGLAVSSAQQAKAQASQAKNAAQAQQQAGATIPTTAQTVNAGDAAPGAGGSTALGRAALISTSSSGVLGTEPVGRKTLLGN